jgi:hypothetical protein
LLSTGFANDRAARAPRAQVSGKQLIVGGRFGERKVGGGIADGGIVGKGAGGECATSDGGFLCYGSGPFVDFDGYR